MVRRVRVVHVDGDRDRLAETARHLERVSDRFSIETATSAAEGLRQVDAETDCVVSGHGMADMDGIELLEAVREEFPELPFLLFTDKGSETIAGDAISAGVTDYLQKGTGVEQYELLANRVENAVERFRTQRRLRVERRRLEQLHEATRDLMEAQNTEAVATCAVETARTVLEQPVNGLWLYDREANVLEPVAMTDEAATLVDEQPVYTEDESLSWRAFDDGELRVYDDVRTEPRRLNAETPIRAEIIVPLGDRGVMNFGTTEPDEYSETDITLARILGRTVETALGRADREQRLRRNRAELERQNERLEDFAGVVGHDLRNPLQVAIAKVSLARDRTESPRLESAADALDRMETLIDDLLKIARTGLQVEQTEPVWLSRAVENCQAYVDTTDATLQVDTDKQIRTDPDRLDQLLDNLVRNAVDHAGDGVTVTVGALPDGFYVADDGPGIPVEQRDDVFEMGYSTTDTGTGFGLAVVQNIAEAHGWQIRIRDGPDGGARFVVTGVEEPD